MKSGLNVSVAKSSYHGLHVEAGEMVCDRLDGLNTIFSVYIHLTVNI